MPGRLRFPIWLPAMLAGWALYGSSLLAPAGSPKGLILAVAMLNAAAAKTLCFRFLPEWGRKRLMVRIWDVAIRFLFWMCVAVALRWTWQLLADFLEHARDVIAYPLPLNSMEGRETVKAWLLAHGRNIYPSMASHPFLVTIYPPVYHAVVAAASLLAGWGIAAARMVSLGAFLTLCLAASTLAWAMGRSLLAAAALLLVVCFDPSLSDWSVHARPDMLAWALSLAGAGLFWTSCAGDWPPGKRTQLAVASGALLCLALFTKQQTVPWLIGCVLWAAGRGKSAWRPALASCCAALVLGALLAGVLEVSSGGHFLRDTVLYPKLMGAVPGVSTTANLLERLEQVWTTWRTLWLLLMAYFGYALLWRRWDLAGVLLVVNAAFLPKLLASWGADINYAFGAVLAAFLCVGVLAGAVARSRPYGRALAFCLLFAWLAPSLGHPRLKVPDASWLEGLSGRILANTEGGHLLLGQKPGRDVVFFDGIETQLYERTGLWNSAGSPLVEDIRDRKFDRLVFYGDFMPGSVADAASIFYRVQDRRDGYTVLSPAPEAAIALVDPSGAVLAKGEGTAASADVSTLARETEGMAPGNKDRTGRLLLTLEAPRELRGVEAGLTVRVDPADPSSGAVLRIEDGQGRVLASVTAPKDGLFEAAIHAQGAGKTVKLVVELTGKAWIAPSRGALAVIRAGE